MKTFGCHCGSTLFFENSFCTACNRVVGYLPDEKEFSTFDQSAGDVWRADYNGREYRQCGNFSEFDVCNWMVVASDPNPRCTACRLNHIIPNLSDPHNLVLWYRMEKSKRRLLYTLISLDLPIVGRSEDPSRGLGFSFLKDDTEQNVFTGELTVQQQVMTGHSSGMITINLAEAEHSSLVRMREQMKEKYRTLLGHFRHESGHYYWDRLIQDAGNIEEFREIFGDERLDYSMAAGRYYENGPPPDWQNVWISAYASMHPWEDWAETWAHYLHMIDTLDTANHFGFRIHGHDVSAPNNDAYGDYFAPAAFDELFNDWIRLSTALNSLNRSMGLDDAYPFVVSISALNKLRYVHRIVQESHIS